MAIQFNDNLLRHSTLSELLSHFTSLVREHPSSEEEISFHLLNLAEQEAIAPTVFQIWAPHFELPFGALEGPTTGLLNLHQVHRYRSSRHIVTGQTMDDFLGRGGRNDCTTFNACTILCHSHEDILGARVPTFQTSRR